PLALCDRCPCFGSLFPPLAALTFAASSIICAFALAAAAPRSPYRHLELCGIALKIKSGEREAAEMIRHILFWKYTDAVKAQHQEAEALKFLQNSVATMRGRIDGLLCIEIGLNLAGGDYDLIFYAELRDEQALQCFQQHPLHAAHRERCKDLVTARLCGDVRVGTN
ncbi:MAG: Dabb family protein, partial [Gemmiger qucibialis]